MKPGTSFKNTGRRSSYSIFSYGARPHKKVSPVILSINDEKSRIKVALDKLSYLKAGWDGLDALPISVSVLQNVSHILMDSDNQDWKDWALEPNVNGTVLLRHNSRMTGISIGSDAFSYYQKDGNNVTGRDAVDFNVSEILSVMRSINP